MREIKFRAWHIELEYMIDWETMRKDAPQGWLMNALTDDQYEFMQYTGLNDDNGVDIYDGDIIRVIEEGTRSNFDRGLYRVCCGEYSLNLTFNKDGYVYGKNDIRGKRLVVGNIYENPELYE
jgi:uncharacterized phage protein (TIGR01671 family)